MFCLQCCQRSCGSSMIPSMFQYNKCQLLLYWTAKFSQFYGSSPKIISNRQWNLRFSLEGTDVRCCILLPTRALPNLRALQSCLLNNNPHIHHWKSIKKTSYIRTISGPPQISKTQKDTSSSSSSHSSSSGTQTNKPGVLRNRNYMRSYTAQWFWVALLGLDTHEHRPAFDQQKQIFPKHH